MDVIFRVDASENIGTGHVQRCLSLARSLDSRGIKPYFICRDFNNYKSTVINSSEYKVSWLTNCDSSQNDAEETKRILSALKPEGLIVDHYSLNAQWESQLREYARKIIVIDDLANDVHDCDVLINHNYMATSEIYENKVPEHCELLLGGNYTLLSEVYKNKRSSSLIRTGQLNRILLFFTSGNDEGETLKAMQGLAAFAYKNIVDVVVGNTNSDIDKIKKYCIDRKWNFHVQIDYMHDLVALADLAIGSAGMNAWERCVLGAPALITILADNQKPNAMALDNNACVINLGEFSQTTPDTYTQALNELNPEQLIKMSRASFNLIDGNGINNVTEKLLSTLTN